MENHEEQIELIIDDLKAGKDHTEIKQDLLNTGVDEAIAAALIKTADSIYLDDLLVRQPVRKPLISRKTIGVLLIFLGVMVTIFTYIRADDEGGVYVIWYGPVLAGIGFLTARSKSRLQAIRETFKSPYDKWRR
ncbi:MAG: hypothetical protein AAFQ94_24680 [Bacteroidota bacterium]